MVYLKHLLINFLIVFFVNYVLPGIDVLNQTKLPYIGGDLIFAFGLGLLNSIIYHGLRILKQRTYPLKIALIVLVLNFVAYAVVRFLPIDIEITSVEGYFLAAALVSIGSFFTNYMEMKRGFIQPM